MEKYEKYVILIYEAMDLRRGRSGRRLKRKAKIITAAVLFAAIAAGGYIVERFERDAFIEEAVVREENVFYEEEKPLPEGAGKININSADRETLSRLHGIGEALADRIIGYRQSHGGFGAIEEIMNVPGISENKFDNIKDDIGIE